MHERERRDQEHEGTETTEEAQDIIGGGDYAALGEDDAPPGGDVRTVYMQDRDPGDPEPDAPQPT